jgi:hypothetical protein
MSRSRTDITNHFAPGVDGLRFEDSRVLKPLAGITHLKLSAPASQASAAAAMMSKRFIDTNQLVLFTNALADDLVWDKERTNQFEAAIRDLGLLVGFGSQRPDEDYKDGGPTTYGPSEAFCS